MDSEKILIKSTPGKNKIAIALLVAGIELVVISLFVAMHVYNNGEVFMYFWSTWRYVYKEKFLDFYFGEFFNFSIYYGYLLILGIIVAIVGALIKIYSEKCEITVTDNRIFGKTANGDKVNIPLNQITGLNTCSFNGISIASIGSVSNFHCIENRGEVMKAISFILANPQKTKKAEVLDNEADQLRRFKNLLDNGIITQEEFDAKKKELLKL